jgi:hypothetical protein
MIASFRATVDNWLGLTLMADVYVSAPSPGGARNAAPLAVEVPSLVAGVPGVAESRPSASSTSRARWARSSSS